VKPTGMNKFYFVAVLRGIGIGFIVASMVFFSLKEMLVEQSKSSLSESEIILKAEELGMIKLTQLDRVYLTDEDIINKAKELGMRFDE
jgi:hypothetical protein